MTQACATLEESLIPEPLLGSLERWVARGSGARLCSVSFSRHSNDLAEMRFDDGRTLVVKRGRFDWAAARFENSRAASSLVREHARLAAPEPVDVPRACDEQPLQAYWRIDLPTLSELWPELGEAERTTALESWGAMLRRLHQIRLPAWGSVRAGDAHGSLADHLAGDVLERLLPAVYGEWPEAAWHVERLAAVVPGLTAAVGDRSPVLVHGDIHMGNILCHPDPAGPICVGLLDLETAQGGVVESDLAIAEVLHGPLFEQHLEHRGWREVVEAGYGDGTDPHLTAFFRAYHLANLGFFSALVGDREHAEDVLRELGAQVRALAGD
jgi:aminoglycoside phosphotransferase (APT) family kinase protein